MRSKGRIGREKVPFVQTPKGKVGSSFVLPENPAPHNSLLMDVAGKLISTLLRKPAEPFTARDREGEREKTRGNKGLFMP
jgi:hypothetical protein